MINKGVKKDMKATPIKAIRKKCLECMCNQYKQVRLCQAGDCPLHPYRMGKRPTKEEQAMLIMTEASNKEFPRNEV